MNAPILHGPSLILRPLRPADVDTRYVSWLNDAEVTRYLHAGHPPSTMESLREYVARSEASENDILWAIVDRAGGTHIGNVSLSRIDWAHRHGDTGIVIGEKAFWRKGLATQAWRLVVEHAFRGLDLHKVIAGSCSDNVGSVGALKSLGFAVEGVLREEFQLDGTYLDVLRFGLLDGELSRR